MFSLVALCGGPSCASPIPFVFVLSTFCALIYILAFSLSVCIQYFSLNKNTGRDVSDSLPAKNGEVVNECKESRENNNPVRTFKESLTVSVRRFEEGPSPLSASRRVNGEAGKTAEAESAKWKSLSISTISIRKEEPESGVGAKDEAKLGGKDESMKEVEATKDKQDSEERDVFARPTFRPSELAPRRMPPAGMLGKDLLHQSENYNNTVYLAPENHHEYSGAQSESLQQLNQPWA